MKKLLAAAVTVIILFSAGLIYLRKPEMTAELKGQKLAGELGCFACHGTGGLEGAANPGAKDNEVPAWSGGTAMMYLKTDEDIRDYIRFGYLKDKKDTDIHQDQALLQMPGYSNRLSDAELEYLTAYVKAVSHFYPDISEKARVGMRTASRLGCFGCHGPSGRGGVKNPGSFKGIIPGWNSKDFLKSVKDSHELKSWIYEGNIPRFQSSITASFFLNRAALKMPAYKNVINPEELQQIVDYIAWMSGINYRM